ncbi:MAG: mechanosensitive ion channel family protein [Wenzhouxiangella sp.]
MIDWFVDSSLWLRLLSIALVAVLAHLAVVLIRKLSTWLGRSQATASIRKLRTVITLATSMAVFAVYFAALGFVFNELGVPLTAYFASATVIGLAVGFGSQGVVQDVVTGLTLIFADLLDVGEMINIGGQVGIVRSIGMRFVTLENSMGARVSIPNRSIGNIINFPRGYLRCIVDIRLSADPERSAAMQNAVESLMPSVGEQFPGIMRLPPSVEGLMHNSSGSQFLRLKFRIWPDRAEPIERSFRPELLAALKKIEPEYADWQVAVYFEVEQRASLPRRGFLRRP